MASKKKPVQYRVVLRGRRGFAKLSKAQSFEIWYGKRRIVSQTKFTKRHNTVKKKEAYLKNLVVRIEREKKRLAKRRLELKAQQLKVREERERQQAAVRKRPVTRPATPLESKRLDHTDQAKSSLLNFPEARSEKSPEFKNIEVIDTTIIPLEPDWKGFEYEVVEKIVHTTSGREYLFSILNLDLHKNEFITLNQDNFEDSYMEALSKLFPYVEDFRRETVDSTEGFIFRFKFAWDPEGNGKYQMHGMSLKRRDIMNHKQMLTDFRKTFLKFYGMYDRTTRRYMTKNYLADDSTIYITGVTMESYDERSIPKIPYRERQKRRRAS